MNIKELKKLAAACRKAGIKHYRCADFEFTLADDMPTPATRRRRTKDQPPAAKSDNEIIAENTLSPEQALFWSSDPTVEQLVNQMAEEKE